MAYDIFSPAAIPKEKYIDGSYKNLKLGVYIPTLKVYYNGSWETLPQTAPGTSFIVSSLVTEGRNSQGVFTGEQIGRNQIKFDGVVFPMLYAHEWKHILNMLKIGSPTYFRFYDFEQGKEIERTLYPGDRKAEILSYASDFIDDEITLRPEVLANCSVNLIDRGD